MSSAKSDVSRIFLHDYRQTEVRYANCADGTNEIISATKQLRKREILRESWLKWFPSHFEICDLVHFNTKDLNWKTSLLNSLQLHYSCHTSLEIFSCLIGLCLVELKLVSSNGSSPLNKLTRIKPVKPITKNPFVEYSQVDCTSCKLTYQRHRTRAVLSSHARRRVPDWLWCLGTSCDTSPFLRSHRS